MDDPFRDDIRDITALRKETEDRIRSKLRGFYFASTDTILGNKLEDQVLLQELCPNDSRNNIASDVTNYIFRTLLACIDQWPVLDADGPLPFWNTIATLGENNSNIHIQPAMARDLVTALIKARQRYVLRQTAIYSDFDLEGDLTMSSDTAAQMILERILILKDPSEFSGDVFRSPLCSEKEKQHLLKHAVQYGPTKKISGNKFQIALRAPQNLHPISDLTRRPKGSSARGFVERLAVGLNSPKSGCGDIPVPRTVPSKSGSTPSQKYKNERPHTGGIGKRKSECLFLTPTRCKPQIIQDKSPLLRSGCSESSPVSKKKVKRATTRADQQVADKPISPTVEKYLRSPFKFRSKE